MPFEQGQSGNPTGRPKGATGKTNRKLRDLLQQIVEAEIEGIPDRLEALKPLERLEVLAKLLPFVLPKQKEILEAPKEREVQVYRIGEQIIEF